ncbi:hypothetical protein ANN_24656 [Periplaneta americana]|uniref:Uncharacterized protein n=1 Tax=Periplaneta americana TaxID=6978 RepID=A0ABQ8S403_PERAM|nr:hypothetical protein ANN_24656 [Periplaneta americana]
MAGLCQVGNEPPGSLTNGLDGGDDDDNYDDDDDDDDNLLSSLLIHKVLLRRNFYDNSVRNMSLERTNDLDGDDDVDGRARTETVLARRPLGWSTVLPGIEWCAYPMAHRATIPLRAAAESPYRLRPVNPFTFPPLPPTTNDHIFTGSKIRGDPPPEQARKLGNNRDDDERGGSVIMMAK